MHDSDQTMRRAKEALGPAVEPLRPEPVGVTAGHESLGTLATRFEPALLAGRFVHRPRCKQRPGRAPQQLLELVVAVRTDPLEEPVGEIAAGRETPVDEQETRLPAQERRLAGRRQLDLGGGEVRRFTPELECPLGRRGEVDPRLDVPAAGQRVERPDHASRTAVEVLQRRGRAPGVPLVRRPEPDRVESGVRVCDDRPDSRAHPLVVPGLFRERLEPGRVEEH